MSSSNRCTDADVELYWSPWVSGTRSAAYFGSVSSEFFLKGGIADEPLGWEKAEHELLESLRDKARRLGANAVIGLAVTLDPFARSEEGESGMHLHAAGTAVKLTLVS